MASYAWVWSIDVVNTNLDISSDPPACLRFEAKRSTFFASFDSLIVRKSHSDAYLCRSSHFGANDNDDRRTKRLLYPLLRIRARGNYANFRKLHVI